MAELALLSLVASLSLLASALLALNGLPEQMPIAAAAAASGLIFGTLFRIYRRRVEGNVDQTSEHPDRSTAEISSDGGELVVSG